MIKRDIIDELLASAAEYPAVTILGPRQSGKTTLARMVFKKLPYCSLEDPDIRALASSDPRGFLNQYAAGAILDEVQRVPELLSYLQTMIDEDRRPGKFILTGSHQPQVQQAISQSLAGRTAVLELLPFCLNEIRKYKLPKRSAFDLIIQGFYPGLHENKMDPKRFYRSYLATYVERDVRMLINLKDVGSFEKFLRLLAGRVGQILNYSSLSADIGVSSMTIKNWVSVLKASYIVYELQPYFANIRKRLVKSSKLYFTDIGLVSYLLGLTNSDQVQRDPLRGHLYENLVIMDIVKHLYNIGSQATLYFYRDSHGNEVDLLIPKGRSFVPVEIKSAETFQPEFIRGIEIFNRDVKLPTTSNGIVLFNGSQKMSFKNVTVCNPLLHGLDDLF
jgi:uncharacterized protein